jgi:hypothetical protein
MVTNTERWIAAGIKLSTDPTARVRCPVKDDGYLVVTDVPGRDVGTFDRYLRCPTCGATEILVRMRLGEP